MDTLSVVVAFDFNPLGRRTLLEALAATECRSDARMHVVHVVAPEGGEREGSCAKPSDNPAVQRMLDKARRQVWAEIFGASGATPRACPIRVHVCYGDPEAALLEVAREQGADWLIIGDTQADPFRAETTGKVGAHVMGTAPCPVVRARRHELSAIEQCECHDRTSRAEVWSSAPVGRRGVRA